MPPVYQENNMLVYKGSNFFKQRLLLATLSGKSLKITDIRSGDIDGPGAREFEICLVQLLDKITNGTKFEINRTGTEVFYQPGLLYGGTFNHDCDLERGIGKNNENFKNER